jgi:hypothetical protein
MTGVLMGPRRLLADVTSSNTVMLTISWPPTLLTPMRIMSSSPAWGMTSDELSTRRCESWSTSRASPS